MIIQTNEIRRERVDAVCEALLDGEREVLWERRGTPLFLGPMDAIRSIKNRYGLTWCELRAVMYAI